MAGFGEGMPPRKFDPIITQTTIRPLPRNLPAHITRVKICDRRPSCRGPHCTFPHSQQEMNEWNRQLQIRQGISIMSPRQGNLRPEWYPQPQVIHQASHPVLARPHSSQLRRPVPRHQTVQEMYAASKESFIERIKEDLNIEIIQSPLTRQNYKKKFHHMICWEEKRHIEILNEKCNGVYNLVLYQERLKPKWLRRSTSDQSPATGFVRYGIIEGIDPDKIAYATQASEAVYIMANKVEVKANIMRENYDHTDENLYIGFTAEGVAQLREAFPDYTKSNKRYDQVIVEFEVKHMFFDGLIKSVNYVDPLIIQRILPLPQDFLSKTSNFFRYRHDMHAIISQLDPDDQLTALKAIAQCPAQSPPILINGSFGTGKTRVLAIAAYYIIEMAVEPARVLICAHHQVSADNFIETYFGNMMTNRDFSKRVRLVRLTSSYYNVRSERFSRFYTNFYNLCKEMRSERASITSGNLLVATTFSTAIRLRELFDPGFFTHILLDEGAQSREPEAIAPLSLASSGTKIVIAGDSCQVGPALLVLGDETRASGFRLSLLERLQLEYEKIGGPAKDCLLTLSTNYRCHEDILAIPHQLFYSGLKSKARQANPHPKAAYPLLFICSNLTSNVCSSEIEARILLEQVSMFIQHWPRNDSSWGDFDPKKIAVVTSTRPQLVTTRNMERTECRNLRHTRMITLYEIQGQEFQAVFLSTTEPVAKDGNTLNPTKSPCDRYIFNTVLTRAKSLVVVVGSPRVLLKTEQHMIKLYGAQGKCWSLYLKSCLEHGTLSIPSLVEADKNVTERFVAELAANVGATLPSDPRKSSRANYRTKSTISNVASSEHEMRRSREGIHSLQSTASQHPAISAKSRIHLVDKRLSSDENIFKQMSQVSRNMQLTSSSYSQSAIPQQHPMGSVPVAINPEGNRLLNSNVTVKQSVQENRISVASSERTSNARSENSAPSPSLSRPKQRRNVEAPKSRSRGDNFPKPPIPKTPAASLVTLGSPPTAASATKMSSPPQQQRNTTSRITADTRRNSATKTVAPSPNTQASRPIPAEPTKSRRAKKSRSKVNVTASSSHPSPSLADYWPTLGDAAKVKSSKKRIPQEPLQCAAPTQVVPVKLPEVHSESFSKYKSELDIDRLKQPLTRESYVEKFHHLLCWEEKEHDDLLKQRCAGIYEVTIFQPGFKPHNLEHNYRIEELIRFGYISCTDGDKLSYAKQASEGSFIILDKQTYIKVKHVHAFVPKDANANAIVFGLTKEANSKLVHWSTLARTRWSRDLQVHFELKHSYFQRLHSALDKITSESIRKIMPNSENFADDSEQRSWNPGKPEYEHLELDSYQQRALRTILNCTPGAPVLVTGPFGTGKTRLLARAAYEILKSPRSKVLICAHHQASVDTFVKILGEVIDNDIMIRVIPNESYHSKIRDEYDHLFVPRYEVNYSLENVGIRLVITTLGTSNLRIRSKFSHILIDEGAQTREPEIISPLHFAREYTKIIIAGDHLQVGPQLLVLGKEAQEHGLATSLLERLHNQYIKLGEVTEKHLASLLTNHRSQSGILMLPSSLFYGSTLQCRTKDKPHPLASYPLQFICTSLKQAKSCPHSTDKLEAEILLNQVRRFVNQWPEKQWGRKDLSSICIMSPSADQFALIKKTMQNRFKELKGIEILKAYEIQGREFKAIFVGTSEITYVEDTNGHKEGEPKNLTKSVSDRYVFNTAITRSQYLVVAVGNPFLLLHIEKCMEQIYGERAADCWSRFMKQCLECNSFHFTDEAKLEFEKEEFSSLRENLYKSLFSIDSEEIIDIETPSDSILNTYKRELEKIPDCKKAKLTLSSVQESDLAWIMSDNFDRKAPTTDTDDEENETYEDTYECILDCHSYRKAEATPIDKQKRIIIIRGSGNRIPAFSGDTVLVGVFPNNPKDKCYGKVLKVMNRGHEPRFLCRVSHRNPVIFYPVDELNPAFCNLPRISRDLLYRRDRGAVEVELESRRDVVVFSSHSVGINIREGKVPPIQQIIPLSVAKDMLFIVAFIQWKKDYRTPLGIVIGAMPKGFTAFSAERLLKMKHGIEYDDDCMNEMSVDAEHGPDSGELYDRVFTIDPDGAQNLDDAVSLVKQSESADGGQVETYQLGIHIVNCAKHIEYDEDIDREARRRGTSVYGGREGKIMQMLPAEIREKLSLKPKRIRDVISVVGTVVISPTGIEVQESTDSMIKIEQAQIKSSIQLTYMTAQQVMDGIDAPELMPEIQLFNSKLNQPSLSKTLQLLYKIALHLRKNRLQSDAAYAYDLNDPEDSYCWQAHMLIEELMIWANSAVAARVHIHYPHAALLRRQPEPNQESFSSFIDHHKKVANLSLSLSRLSSGVQCHNDGAEEEVSFVLAVTTLNQIREAISTKNLVRLTSLIASDRYHPQIAAVLSKLRSLFPKAEYCCTDEGEEDSLYRHYSLKLDNYTHFSSPLRRYLDIEVQRMLVQLLEASKLGIPPKEFNHDDHVKLCIQLNNRVKNANQFQRSLNDVDLAIMLSSSSKVYEAYIVDNVKGTIEIWFPQLELKDLPKKEKKIPLKFLGPFASIKDEDLLKRESHTFHWKMKITSFTAGQGKFIFKIPGLSIHSEDTDMADTIMEIDLLTCYDDSSSSNSTLATLSTVKTKASRRTPIATAIPLNDWRKALSFVREPSTTKLKVLEAIFPKQSAVNPAGTPNIDAKLSSPFVTVKHRADFKPHDVIQVWMTRSMGRSLIAPAIQLVEVSPLVRICVQHNSHPSECFSDVNLSYASRKFYSDINEYVELWEKIVLAEAAEISVRDSSPVVIQDVTLKWPHLSIPSNCIDEEYYQPTDSIALSLPEKYVDNCSEFIKFNEGDLVCARYGTDPHAEIRAVFHMVIHKIQYEEEDETRPSKVWMKFIGENNSKVFEKMKAILDTKCELQLISLSTTSQRVYQGLLKLLDASGKNKEQESSSNPKKPRKKREISKLVAHIALGSQINVQVTDENKKAAIKVFKEHLQARQMWMSPNVVLNRVQDEACNQALTNPFKLIQGPPGTGKSETGAHIAYTFAMANRRLSPKKCVLYCGPSNKSVDVVLEKFHTLCKLNLKLKLKILRIYNRAVEKQDFPGPDNREKLSEYKLPECAPNYTLHHKIRQNGPHASKLNEFEEKFQTLPPGSVIDGKTYREYRQILIKAEDAVLAEHFDIVMCTCSESSSYRVRRCIFPRQCIVDECGMASEPECITPLQLCEHVVLIGDHKQLQPVIMYKPAAEHGLSTSLFQRYAEKFEGEHIKRLTIQYRMHEAICEFPSNHFYDGQLETDDSVKRRTNPETKLDGFWSGPERSRCPILFCHVIGKEDDHKTGSKTTGGKKIGVDSKFNETEAMKVIEIATTLYKVHGVNMDQIAVLTPYSAQKTLINKKMKEANLKIKVASITESQGDEYGIVILSTVRSLPEKEIANPDHVQADRGWLYETLGFLTDPHQLNVGITRSKYGLIIVGNQLLLRYDENWKALIEHYTQKKCLLMNGEEFCKTRSTYFNEAEKRAQVPFMCHHLLECDYNALEYTIEDHDITLRIPEGAVSKGAKFHIEIGVAMYGPFIFPEKTQIISPIVWLCVQESVELKKPLRLILPHFLVGLSRKRLQYHNIAFAKASHEYSFENGQMMYKFEDIGAQVLLASSGNKGYGVIRSTHCCFYCIEANHTPELARDAGYCLARIENNSVFSHQRNEICFTAVYFLRTCIKALEEQFPEEDGYKITRYDAFTFNIEQPEVCITIVPCDESDQYTIALEPLSAKIKASEIDFWREGFDRMQLKHMTKVYPPRVKMTIILRDFESHKLLIKFLGCSTDCQLDTELILPLGSLCLSRSSSATSGSVLEHRSHTVFPADDKPELKDAFKTLLPLASSWKSIGTLLGLRSDILDGIQLDERSTVDQLQAVTSKWLKQVNPPPTWKVLADAIEEIDEQKAQELKCTLA